MTPVKNFFIFWFLMYILNINQVAATVLSVLYELPHLPLCKLATMPTPIIQMRTQRFGAVRFDCPRLPTQWQKQDPEPAPPPFSCLACCTVYGRNVSLLFRLMGKSTDSWASHVTPLCLGFLTGQTATITLLTSDSCCED